MKLVKVDHHSSCANVVASTYFWADENTDSDKFRFDVTSAKAAYLKAQEEALAFVGPRPSAGARADYLNIGPNTDPDITVGQLRDRAKATQAEYEAWNTKRTEAMRTFGSFMIELGYRPFGAPEPALGETVGWGRGNSGDIRSEHTEDPGSDLPGSLRTREIKTPVPDEEGAYFLEDEEFVTTDPADGSTPVVPRDPFD